MAAYRACERLRPTVQVKSWRGGSCMGSASGAEPPLNRRPLLPVSRSLLDVRW